MNNELTGGEYPSHWSDEQDEWAHIEDELRSIGMVPVMTHFILILDAINGSFIVQHEYNSFSLPCDHVLAETKEQALKWWSVGENGLHQVREGVWKAEKELYSRSERNTRTRPAKQKHNQLEVFIEDGVPTALAQCSHCRAIYHQEYYPEADKDLYEFDEVYAVLSGKHAQCTLCLGSPLRKVTPGAG